jgi:hypothetical protein
VRKAEWSEIDFPKSGSALKPICENAVNPCRSLTARSARLKPEGLLWVESERFSPSSYPGLAGVL